MTRILLPLLATTLLLPATAGTFALPAPEGCATKVAAFEARYLAAGRVFDRDAALALRDAVDSCPAAPGRADPVATTGTLTEGGWELTNGAVRAASCGWTTSPDARSQLGVPMHGYYSVAFDTRYFSDVGPATVSYNGADVTYTTAGAEWGFTSTSAKATELVPNVPQTSMQGSGVVTIFGVEIPATGAQAYGGCSGTNSSLCWGSGWAKVEFPEQLGFVYIESRFFAC